MFYSSFFRSLSVNAEVKELLKSIHICRSYSTNKSGTFLWTTVYYAVGAASTGVFLVAFRVNHLDTITTQTLSLRQKCSIRKLLQ